QLKEVVIGYERTWAMGSGKSCTCEDGNEMCGDVGKRIGELSSEDVGDASGIEYGGSVKGKKMKEYMGESDMEGGLAGGGSLKVEDFEES
ncbi:triose-phosphate isomerase, partial [Staphylococcus warneri]|uniref:triose-phosphate isomerase n=1 Tax=Staphylococcus warneri TaxID=1292 RepID=UPI0011A74422